MCGVCIDDSRNWTLSALFNQLARLNVKIIKAEAKGDNDAVAKYKFQRKATSLGVARILKEMELA